MFTGIVTHTSKVKSSNLKNGSLFLTIATPKGWKLTEGESVATNGVCLTVKKRTPKDFIFELMPETLKKTTFSSSVPKEVNLERSLRLGDRISGHFATGHIDTVGKIKKIASEGTAKIYSISFPKQFQKFIVAKGSLCVDGISLTVVDKQKGLCRVALLPYTLKKTTLGTKSVSMDVNLEFDILAKYAQNKI